MDAQSNLLEKRAGLKREYSFLKDLLRDKYLYLLLAPGLLYFLLFHYVPMYGLTIAFQKFNMFKGITGSEWVGLENFKELFTGLDFGQKFLNTLIISFLKLLFGFPAPIILALLLNELGHAHFKKFTQTVLYLPHFVSWVVLGGIMIAFLNGSDGVLNDIIKLFGGTPVDFLADKAWIRSTLVISEVYKSAGWGTVVYLAAISTIDPQLYEAAIVDGAKKLQQMWYITLPSISSVIVVLMILSLGNILNAGFDQIFVLVQPIVYEKADIIDYYVYRKGIQSADYGLATAAGLFKSVIAFVLIVSVNKLAKLFDESALW